MRRGGVWRKQAGRPLKRMAKAKNRFVKKVKKPFFERVFCAPSIHSIPFCRARNVAQWKFKNAIYIFFIFGIIIYKNWIGRLIFFSIFLIAVWSQTHNGVQGGRGQSDKMKEDKKPPPNNPKGKTKSDGFRRSAKKNKQKYKKEKGKLEKICMMEEMIEKACFWGVGPTIDDQIISCYWICCCCSGVCVVFLSGSSRTPYLWAGFFFVHAWVR